MPISACCESVDPGRQGPPACCLQNTSSMVLCSSWAQLSHLTEPVVSYSFSRPPAGTVWSTAVSGDSGQDNSQRKMLQE